MPNWRDEYVASIKESDEADPVNTALIITCTIYLFPARIISPIPRHPYFLFVLFGGAVFG